MTMTTNTSERRSRRQRALIALACVLAAFSSASVAENMLSSANCESQVVFQSDAPGDPYGYLEDQQRMIYSANPGIADPYSLAELRGPRAVSTFAELKKRALEACPEHVPRSTCALDPDIVEKLFAAIPCMSLPTRFESPLFASLIALHSEEIAKVRVTRYPNSPSTRFGSLPTGVFDAQAVLPPNSEFPLVILNRDIFLVTGALSKSISDAMPIKDGPHIELNYSDDAIIDRLKDNPHIVENFADAMARIVRNGTSMGANEVTLDEIHTYLHARLVGAMDLFLIAHEEAHVILNHVSDRSVGFKFAGSSRPGGAREIAAVWNDDPLPEPATQGAAAHTLLTAQLRTREQELEADALGLRLLIWAQKNRGDPISELVGAAAPHIIFRILEAANSYGAEAGGWTFGDANHPASEDRVAALDVVLKDMSRENEVLRQADLRPAFDAVLRVLLKEADSRIRRILGLSPETNGK